TEAGDAKVAGETLERDARALLRLGARRAGRVRTQAFLERGERGGRDQAEHGDGDEEIGEVHQPSVAAVAGLVNVQYFGQRSALRQSHHRPAAGLDLGVLARPAAPAVAASLHRVRRLVTPTLHLAPVEDDLDVLLEREHLLERVVQLPPALRDDEEKSVHDVVPQSIAARLSPPADDAGPTGAHARRRRRPAAPARRRSGGRRSGDRSAVRPCRTRTAPTRPAGPSN